ncbi:hypothetical protein EJB05_01396, partial [Eragrostis curvula]
MPELAERRPARAQRRHRHQHQHGKGRWVVAAAQRRLVKLDIHHADPKVGFFLSVTAVQHRRLQIHQRSNS